MKFLLTVRGIKARMKQTLQPNDIKKLIEMVGNGWALGVTELVIGI